MSEEQDQFQNWIKIINDFFVGKKESEEVKFLKEEIKKLNQQYADVNYFDDPELEYFFDTKKNKKVKGQSDIEFQRKKALKILRLKKKTNNFNSISLITSYRSEIKKIKNKFEPRTWLNENAKKAKSVNFATHVIKLTHSSIDSSSFYDEVEDTKKGLLTTSALNKPIIDGAVIGNQFAPIFQFLELELNGIKLASRFANLDDKTLEFISENEEQIKQWNAGFNEALTIGEKSTHSLAKQIYFPVKNADILNPKSYHLLCNVKSSSLAHSIFEAISDNRFNETKKFKDKNKYYATSFSSFPGKGKLGVTSDNHGNASQLNGKRGGKLFLLTAQPPTWQSQLKPPVDKKSLFDYCSTPSINDDIYYLREYLLRFERLDLSIKDPKRQDWIVRKVQDDTENGFNSIIDEVLFYLGSIQNLSPGWTDNELIKLKPEHQYCLDPYRDNPSFQNQRKTTNWQSVVCQDFAQWLNHKLKGDGKQFTPQREHTRLWQRLFAEPLREHCEMLELAPHGNNVETQV